MAQTGYTPIQLYYSTTTTNTPSAGNLLDGELAINTADGKLFYKDNLGVVQLLASNASSTGTVSTVSVVSTNGFAGTVATATTTPAITLSTTVTGIVKGNGTSLSAAVSGTDYAPATSGTSILYGNGSGGFSNVTVGTGLSFSTGTLTATATSSQWTTSGSDIYYNTGNVGIGTSSPSSFGKLAIYSVSGTTQLNVVSGGSTVSDAGLLQATGGSYNTQLYQYGNGGSSFYTNGTSLSIFIGTANPIIFGTNNTERMRISAAGGVFVGSAGTDPGANNFQVSGAIVSTRVNPRSLALSTTSGAITPDSDSYDQVNYSLTGSSSFSNPSGTPVNGQKLNIRLYAASTQTISSWSSGTGGYRAIGVTLPTSITGTKTIYVGCVWNSTDSFWDVVAVATQA